MGKAGDQLQPLPGWETEDRHTDWQAVKTYLIRLY